MHNCDKLYINGDWVPALGTGDIDSINPVTEQVIGCIPEGTAGGCLLPQLGPDLQRPYPSGGAGSAAK